MTPVPLLADAFISTGLAVAGAAAVSIPIAIHLLTRLRRQQQPWAAMRFLIEAYRRQRQRLRLEQLLLLLVRRLLVLVLGLALAGPIFSGLSRSFGGDTSGRLVCFVIDDALSSQAAGASDQHSRLDHLAALAGRVLDTLSPGDRVAVWTTARPVEGVVAPPTADLAQIRRALGSLHGRASHSDWPTALAAVNTTLTEQNLNRDRVTLYLLGDFSAGAVDADRPLPATLGALGGRARIVTTHPMPSAPNFQIASLTPFRSMILPQEGAGATVPVDMRLRRFGTDARGGTTGVQVDLIGADPVKPLASVRQDFRWSPGQVLALVHLDVPITPDVLSAAAGPGASTAPAAGNEAVVSVGGGSGQALTLRASLQTGGEDALPLDNQRYAFVELRRRLEVGLIDDASTPAVPGEFRPRDWLSLVLEPEALRGGAAGPSRSIDLVYVSPALIDAPALGRLDAVIVLRPDLAGPPGWVALKNFVRRGGLAWIFTPPTDAPALWANAFKEQFGLDWQIGLAPHVAEANTPAGPDANAAWRLAVDAPTPEPLRLLSTDWQALLRPISIKRRLDLSTRGGQESMWLRVADAPGGTVAPVPGSAPAAAPAPARATTPSTLLAAAAVGEGHVLFLATALDPSWSNLITKPLFLPLMHETLRGVLGSGTEAVRPFLHIVAGDQPPLGPRWEGTQELVQAGGYKTIPVLRNDHGLQPSAPLERPGVYAARPGAGLRLAVNADADAGNTTALDNAVLGQWLSTLGDWLWLDEESPAAVLLAEPPHTNLGWPLLWATLALLLLETYLARRFSHAIVPPAAPAGPGGAADDGSDEGDVEAPRAPVAAAAEAHEEAAV